jgi:hypothetical protein
MNIQEFKQQYPAYKDIPDDVLADKLYNKFYSTAMSREDFNKKLGMQTQVSTQPQNGIVNQIGQGIGNTAQDLIGMGAGAINAIVHPVDTAKSTAQALSHPVDLARDVTQGALQGTINLGALLNKGLTAGVNKALGTQLAAPDVSNFAAPVGSGKSGLSNQIARGFGSFAPLALTGGESILGQLLAASLSSAANAPKGNEVSGLTEGLLTSALPLSVLKGAEALRPSSIFRGNLSPEQLSSNLQQTAGTTTGLGDVIHNKFLKDTMENTLPSLPFSNANETMQKTAQQVNDKGADLLKKMLGDTQQPEDIPATLQSALGTALKSVQQQKRQKYNELNTEAEKSGLTISNNNLQQTAADRLTEIQSDPDLARKVSPAILADLQHYAAGNADKKTLKNADILRGMMGDSAQSAFENGNNYEYGIHKDLQGAIQSDINESINNSGNDKLKQLRDSAHKFYATSVAPFETAEIMKYTRQGGDPDLLLNSFIKTTSVSDRGRLLKQLMEKLPENQSRVVPFAYYSRAVKNGEFNPQKFASLHNALGEEQKRVLVSDDNLRKSIDNYSGLVQKNKEPLNAMFNPPTGARNKFLAPLSLMSSGASIGSAIGGIPGAILGATTGLIAPGLASRPIAKALTSEKIRNNLVNAMVQNKVKINTPRNRMLANTLMQALTNQPGAR